MEGSFFLPEHKKIIASEIGWGNATVIDNLMASTRGEKVVELVGGAFILWFALAVEEKVDCVECEVPSNFGTLSLTIDYEVIYNAVLAFEFFKRGDNYAQYLYVFEKHVAAYSIWMSLYPGKNKLVVPKTPLFESGQMKIFTHAVEIMSHSLPIIKSPVVKILVVGSSGSDALTSGRTYPLLRFLLDRPCHIDCYDPEEERTQLCQWDTKYKFTIQYYKKKYPYEVVGAYDIVFDDAWVGGDMFFFDYQKVYKYY